MLLTYKVGQDVTWLWLTASPLTESRAYCICVSPRLPKLTQQEGENTKENLGSCTKNLIIVNLGVSRMICEHPCQVKHYCPPFLQMILLPVGPDGSTSLANCMSFLCARAGQDMSSPSKWFWACDSRPWPGLMQELCSLSPWECHHLSGSFLALDIFCPSSQCKVLKQWMRKGVVAIGWYGQPDKCCPIRDSVPYLLFDFFFRWLKTI